MQKKILTWMMGCLLLAHSAHADNYATPGQFIGSKTLVTFWSGDCASCGKQLPILVNVAKMNPTIKLYVIYLQGLGEGNDINAILPANMLVRYVAEASSTLRSFGATASMLPFSALIADDGTVCRSHAGVQGAATLEDWINKC